MNDPAPPFTPFTAPPAAGMARILWCDADAERGARAKRALAGRATVDVIADAGAAFQSARGILPDLVVAAVEAGGGEPALVSALRTNDRTRTVPVLLVAPNGEAAEAARRFMKPPAAVADVLAEPFAEHELAARVGAQIEILRLRRALAEKELESETWLGLALKASGLGVWHAPLSSGELNMDANLAAMFGLPPAPTRLTDADWLSRVHLDDRPRLVAELAALRQDLRPLEIDFRTVAPDGAVRSLAVLGAVVRHADDVAYRSVGVARDVTERARNAERQQLLLGELNHRVRNTLATVLSLAQQTAQDAPSVAAFLTAFQARVMALAAAHNLLTRGHWRGASLTALVETTLAPERSAKPPLHDRIPPRPHRVKKKGRREAGRQGEERKERTRDCAARAAQRNEEDGILFLLRASSRATFPAPLSSRCICVSVVILFFSPPARLPAHFVNAESRNAITSASVAAIGRASR